MWKLTLLLFIPYFGLMVFNPSTVAITIIQDNLNANKDTVYMFFLPSNKKYEKRERGSVNLEGKKVRRFEYVIYMYESLDLCFGNDFREEKELAYQTLSFGALKGIDIKEYDWLTENFQDKDFKVLCNQKLKIKTTEFYLVVPDSINREAEILHVFNCNYTYYDSFD